MNSIEFDAANARANNAASVLNTVVGPDLGQPIGAYNVPIAMTEGQNNSGSANFGTDRPLQGGKCIVGDGSAYAEIPNIDFSEVVAWEIKISIDLSVGIINQSYFLSLGYDNGDAGLAFGIDNSGVFKVIVYIVGADPSIIVTPIIGVNNARLHYDGVTLSLYNNDVFIGDLTETVDLSGGTSNIGTVLNLTVLALKVGHVINNIEINDLTNDTVLAHYKLESESTTQVFDSSGNGNHGTIVNYYDGFWEEQNEYSYADEEGFTDWYWGLSDLRSYIDGVGGYRDYVILESSVSTDISGSLTTGTFSFTFQHSANPFQTGTHPVNSHKSYKLILKVEDLLVGDFVMKFSRSGVVSSPISNNGVHEVILEIGVSTAYGEYIFIGNNACDARITLVSVECTTDIGTIIPKDDSITLPPFKDVLGNDLQYIGKAPSRAEFKEGNAWAYFATSYFAITGILTTDTVEVFGSSDVPTIPVNGQLHIASGENAYCVRILRLGVEWACYTFSTYMLNPATHTAYDVSGNGNHATLVNGSTANRGTQDEYFYDQLGHSEGIVSDGTSDYLETNHLATVNTKISIWGRVLSFTALIDLMAGQQEGSTQLWMGTYNGNWYGNFGGSATGNNVLADADWHLFEFDKDAFKVDGVIVTSFTGSVLDTGSETLYILARSTSAFGLNWINMDLSRCLIEESGIPVRDFRVKGDLIEDVLTGTIYQNKTNTASTVFTESQHIPALASDITKDALGNPITLPQDGNSFLDTGTEIAAKATPRVIQADKENLFFDIDGNPINKSFSSLTYGVHNDQYYTDNSEDSKISQIVMHNHPLNTRQHDTERVVRNIGNLLEGIGDWIIGTNFIIQ